MICALLFVRIIQTEHSFRYSVCKSKGGQMHCSKKRRRKQLLLRLPLWRQLLATSHLANSSKDSMTSSLTIHNTLIMVVCVNSWSVKRKIWIAPPHNSTPVFHHIFIGKCKPEHLQFTMTCHLASSMMGREIMEWNADVSTSLTSTQQIGQMMKQPFDYSCPAQLRTRSQLVIAGLTKSWWQSGALLGLEIIVFQCCWSSGLNCSRGWTCLWCGCGRSMRVGSNPSTSGTQQLNCKWHGAGWSKAMGRLQLSKGLFLWPRWQQFKTVVHKLMGDVEVGSHLGRRQKRLISCHRRSGRNGNSIKTTQPSRKIKVLNIELPFSRGWCHGRDPHHHAILWVSISADPSGKLVGFLTSNRLSLHALSFTYLANVNQKWKQASMGRHSWSWPHTHTHTTRTLRLIS